MEYSKLSDEELVKNIKEDRNPQDNLSELINRHSGIYLEMINGYTTKSLNQSFRDEMLADKEYQIYASALKYNPEKGAKFSTYLGNETKWKCLNFYNKNKRHPSIPIQEELIDFFNYKFVEENSPNIIKNVIFQKIISKAKQHPDQRVGKIFHLRYVEGRNNTVMPWKYISSKLKLSIQGCINIHNTAIKQLQQSFNKE